MKPRRIVARATSPDGTAMDLIEHDGAYTIMADGLLLMSTKMVHSEEELARLGCIDLAPGARVLIGGLGCGYTLRATLDRLPDGGRAVQSELVPAVVEWNRGPLAGFADHPLDDPRTELITEDVGRVIGRAREEFGAILLDVDNGPSAIVTNTNDHLYGDEGIDALWRALVPGGRVAVWSTGDESDFLARLRHRGFRAERHRVRSRPNGKGPWYIIYVGQRS